MVFYTRDEKSPEDYANVVADEILDGLVDEFGDWHDTMYGEYFTEHGTEILFDEEFSFAIYERAEVIEEANITGFLAEFNDDETEAIIDRGVAIVFELFEQVASCVCPTECTLGEVVQHVRDDFDAYDTYS